MSKRVYLAVDLGAESGHVKVGIWNGSKLRLEEVNRFPYGELSSPAEMREVVRGSSPVQQYDACPWNGG